MTESAAQGQTSAGTTQDAHSRALLGQEGWTQLQQQDSPRCGSQTATRPERGSGCETGDVQPCWQLGLVAFGNSLGARVGWLHCLRLRSEQVCHKGPLF